MATCNQVSSHRYEAISVGVVVGSCVLTFHHTDTGWSRSWISFLEVSAYPQWCLWLEMLGALNWTHVACGELLRSFLLPPPEPMLWLSQVLWFLSRLWLRYFWRREWELSGSSNRTGRIPGPLSSSVLGGWWRKKQTQWEKMTGAVVPVDQLPAKEDSLSYSWHMFHYASHHRLCVSTLGRVTSWIHGRFGLGAW